MVLADATVPRLILPLSLTFDHRIAGGADAARFVSDLVHDLEDPDRLPLGSSLQRSEPRQATAVQISSNLVISVTYLIGHSHQ